MFLIQQITSNPLQDLNLVLPDGTSLDVSIYFRPMQFGWFINQLTYGTFILQGVRITNSPNILQQFKNQIPFGLACYSLPGSREPSQASDFSSGASSLYILTSDEVAEYTAFLTGG